jgi:Ran GTPase-activating protein 1
MIGSRALASALPSWPSLQTLNVGDCLLGRKGSLVVLNALLDLHPTSSLQTLILQYNEMQVDGARKVLELVRVCRGLRGVVLNGNAFSAEEGVVEEIREALRGNGWVDGLDELDDMEEPDSEEEEEEDDDEEEEEEEGKNDDGVDELTKSMKETKV